MGPVWFADGAGGSGITVSGGGRVAVGTLELFAVAAGLDRTSHVLQDAIVAIDLIDRAVSRSALVAGDAPFSAARAELAIDDARRELHGAAVLAGALSLAVRWSADAYGAGEALARDLARRASAELAMGVGFTGPLLLLLSGPLLAALAAGSIVPVLAGVGIGGLLSPGPATGGKVTALVVRHWLWRQRGVLGDPGLIRQVRLVVSSLDDALGAAGGLPAPVIRFLGDDGIGLTGLPATASVLAGTAGAVGALREGPVRVRRTAGTTTVPATGFLDRAERIPRAPDQVRIDRYVTAGEPDRFEVYIGGTRDFSPVATTEPWDLTSNVASLSGEQSGAYRAVAQGLAAAGADADSPVVVTGYSHGGTVAAQLAASGDYDVRGVYTLGALAAGVPVPAEVPWVAIEHTDDLVPALGGTWNNEAPVLVTREALAGAGAEAGSLTGAGAGADAGAGGVAGGAAGAAAGGANAGAAGSDGRDFDDSLLLPAHELARYRETAAMLDGATEDRVIGARAAFGEMGRGADRVESTWYQASREKRG